MNPQTEKKREWPKLARGPLGNTARFDCRGDVPHGWTVIGEKAPEVKAAPVVVEEPSAGLKAAREAYKLEFGKKPHHSWTEAELHEKLSASL